MNVLLSRAKWKLVIIGSLEFLRHRFDCPGAVPSDHPLSFLSNLINTLDELTQDTGHRGTPEAEIIELKQLFGTHL